MELFGAAACSIALVDETTNDIVYRVASGAGAREVLGLRLPMGRGVAGWVVSSGMPISIDELASDPRFGREVAEQTGYVPNSILATPLETTHTVLGVLSVLDRGLPSDDIVAQREMGLLGLFARQAALAIDAARVYGDIGGALLKALALATDNVQVAELATLAAADATGPSVLVLEVAALFARLGRADPELRNIAGTTLEDFVAYAESRSGL
jgi:GAF domain-containing protein